MNREKLGQTDFGNYIAVPHTDILTNNKKFVCVTILDKPIWWGHNDVQVILLVSLEKNDKNIDQFYQIISDFLNNSEGVKQLIRNPNFALLIKTLGS